MPADMLAMQDTLRKYGYGEDELKSKVVAGAQHNELFWRSEFKEAFLWLFPEASGVSEVPKSGELKLFPNPVQDMLFLDLPQSGQAINLRMYSITGAVVINIQNFSGNQVETGNLPAGKYIVKISGKGSNFSGWFVKE